MIAVDLAMYVPYVVAMYVALNSKTFKEISKHCKINTIKCRQYCMSIMIIISILSYIPFHFAPASSTLQ